MRPVLEPNERYCLAHRDKHARLRWIKYWQEQKAEAKSIAALCVRRWRDWQPLTPEETWACPGAITRHWNQKWDPPPKAFTVCDRDSKDRYYEEATALYREPAASNWPHARLRTRPRALNEGKPRHAPGTFYNLPRFR